ncbi:MAG: molybdopterin-dependent oxidoreductase, partial [Gammaproteobacteria bacterium]|nr:molybdopterin-dependent oxidoreductase [Gammaproteobacteria bacterium]
DHEMSGNVIDLCPVGALNSKPFRMRARGWEMAQRETISAHDCAGSNTFSHILRGELMRVVPRANEAINETWISDRDRFGYTGIYSEERLQKPMIKKNGVWQEVDWEVALEASVKILKTISEEESGDQIGVLASPSATLEELYLLRKVADEFATRNIDHRINQHDFSDDDDFPAWPWIGARISDLEHIDAGLLIGSNIRKEVPIIGHRIRKAALRGADVMFINPGRFEHLFPVSEYINADVAGMLNQIAALLKAVAVHAGKQVPKHLQKITGEATPDEAMKNMAAKLVNGKKTIVLLGLLAEAHPASADIRILAAAIADIANAAIGYLSSGANSAGAWLTGAVPHRDIGGKPSAEKGLNAKDMLAKKRRAYFLLGVEPHIDCWDAAVASEAMKNADVIALSPFVSESIKEYADVLLPIGTWGETGGTFINAEGERQSFQGAANPVGEARPAWKVLRVFGNLLGIDGFDYMSVEEVANEAVDAIGEIKPNSSLRGEREVKPLPVESGFMRCGDTALYGADMLVRRAVPLQNSADAKLASTARLSPADAKKLGVSSSDKVVIKQNGSSVTLPVSIDEGIVAGSVWLSSGVVATAGLGPKFGSITVEKA